MNMKLSISNGFSKRMLAILIIVFMVTMVANPIISADNNLDSEVSEVIGETPDIAPEVEEYEVTGRTIWAPGTEIETRESSPSGHSMEQFEGPMSLADSVAYGMAFTRPTQNREYHASMVQPVKDDVDLADIISKGGSILNVVPDPKPLTHTFYTDRATFDASAPGLPIEDFELATTPPGVIDATDVPLDENTNNAVFPLGSILPGIQFQDDPIHPPDGIVALGAGVGGNPSTCILSNYNTGSFDILFPNTNTFAAGMDLTHFWDPPATVNITIYGEGGVVMDTTTSTGSEAGNFWGVISNRFITRININSTLGAWEGVDNIAFGYADVPNSPMPTGICRYGHAELGDDNTFFVISGIDGTSTIVPDTWRYEVDIDVWTPLMPIPGAAEGITAIRNGDYIYAMGGSGTNQHWIYDILADMWFPGAPVPRNVWGAAIGAWDGQIFLIGGDPDMGFGGTSSEVNIYDIVTDTWVGLGTPMPIPRSTPGHLQVGQYIYIVGGWGDLTPGANVDQTHRYNMATDTWETGPTFGSARGDFALSIANNVLYAMGGDADGGGPFDSTDTIETLDLDFWPGGTWTAAGTLPVSVMANDGGYYSDTLTGGEVWSVGGIDAAFTIIGDAIHVSDPYEYLVGLYDHAAFADISYFFGGNMNTFASYQLVVDNDPAHRFASVVITDLLPTTLAGIDALVLPDNAVPDVDLANVSAWFTPRHGIIAIDSAVCYAAYSGYMWPAAAGTNGNPAYWDYGSMGGLDQEIITAHKITEDYLLGNVYDCRGGDAFYHLPMLPADAIPLTMSQAVPPNLYSIARDVPSAGRIVGLGPYDMPPLFCDELIRDAIEWSIWATEWEVDLDPNSQFKMGGPGTNVDHILTVYNTGLNADTYDLSVAGNVWPTTLYSIVAPPSMVNPSYETGDFTGWITQDLSAPFWALQVGGAGLSPGFGFFTSDPTDGTFAALSGWDGNGPGMIMIEQDIVLPTGITTLEFDYRAAWDLLTYGAVLDRTFTVEIQPFGGGAPLQSDLILNAAAGTLVTDTGDMVGSVDLTSFGGSAVRISFNLWVSEPSSGPAFFQLDNIRLSGSIIGVPITSIGPINVGANDSFIARVSIPGGTPLGDIDTAFITATSQNDDTPLDGTANDTVSITTQCLWAPKNVALFKDIDPWGTTSIEDILTAYNIPYDLYTSADVGAVALGVYDKVIIPSSQPDPLYTALEANQAWLDDYVFAGGVLQFSSAETMGTWDPLPGGYSHIQSFDDVVSIDVPGHQFVTVPNLISDVELDGWGFSTHSFYDVMPQGAVAVCSDTFGPCVVESAYGWGRYITSGMTLEWGYAGGFSDILENIILCMNGTAVPPPILTPDTQTGYGHPGTDIDFTVTVTNTGPFDDAYWLTASGVDWTMDFYDITGSTVISSTGPVPAGGSVDFLVRMTVPFGEANLDFDQIEIFATSQNTTLYDNAYVIGTVLYMPTNVALFRETDPWFYTSVQDILTAWGIPFDIYTSSDIGTFDLSVYDKVIISDDQPEILYSAVESNLGWFEEYVFEGGIMQFSAAADFWESGTWDDLPRSYLVARWLSDTTNIAAPGHQFVSVPNPISDAELDGWGPATYGYFYDMPQGTLTICTDAMGPNLVESGSGSGFYFGYVIPMIRGFGLGRSRILENVILCMNGTAIPQAIDVTVSPHSQGMVANPGDTVIYPKQVRNYGTVVETFDLSLDTFVWPTSIMDETATIVVPSVSLFPGEIFNFTVVVDIPVAAVSGEFDIAVVNASSQTDPLIFELATTQTAIPVDLPYFDAYDGTGPPYQTGDNNPNPGTQWEWGDPSGFANGPESGVVLLAENFEGAFPPAGWTITDDIGMGAIWLNNTGTGKPNYIGSGLCADADNTPAPMDSGLWTPPFDLVGYYNTASLEFDMCYNDTSPGSYPQDIAEIRISINGTASQQLIYWDADVNPTGPGMHIVVDLTAYIGEVNILLDFRFFNDVMGGYYWQIDNVVVRAAYISECWATNLLSDYAWGADCYLYTPYFNMPSTATAIDMSFMHWYVIDPSWEDGGWIEVSTDFGATWSQITPLGGYPEVTEIGVPGYVGNVPCYAGSTGTWTQADFDLSVYAGQTVKLRFRFWSETFGEPGFPGWYIDNINISATIPAYAVELTPDTDSLTGMDGTSVYYLMTVMNMGASPDSFDLSASGVLGWTVNYYDIGMVPIPPLVGPVSSGGSVQFYAEVVIPGGTADGSVETTSLTATSVNDPGPTPAADTSTLDTVVDSRPPDHSNEFPAIDGFTNDLQPTISVHVTDIAGVNPATIDLRVQGFPVATNLNPIVNGFNVSYWHSAGFTPGDTVTCRILAQDTYGNQLDFTWTFTVITTFSVPLQLGWNLVSFPVTPFNTSINSVLGSIAGDWDIVQAYDASDPADPWKTYSTFKPPALNDLTDLDEEMSFWIHTTAPCTLSVDGLLPAFTAQLLRAGWNLVGYPTMTPETVANAFAGTGYTAVEGFNATAPYNISPLADTYMMQPGEGYWVHVPADTIWLVNW